MIDKLRSHRFLFEELVKRDFKKKYKRTILGVGWSMLSPLLMLLVMKVVFENFFGRTINHYTTYLFCGLLTFNWFSESTNGGMRSLFANASIFTKVNVPKYLFLFATNIQVLLNFALTMLVFYTVDSFPPKIQLVFAMNPVYCHIAYFREVVLAGNVPSLAAHLTLLGFAVAAFLAGAYMYKHYNTKFLYYV